MPSYILPILSMIASFIALYFTIRKQLKDGKNIDIDTISKLYSTIKQQEERYDSTVKTQEIAYQKLLVEFEAYKTVMNGQIAELHKERLKLQTWADKLVKQLESVKITPEPF